MNGSKTAAMRRFMNWIPAMMAVTVIACESTATMSASNTSRWLLPLWIHLFGPVTPERWGVIHHIIRKTGHFIGYGLVSLSFFYGWRNSLSSEKRSLNALRGWSSVLGVFCAFIVASGDEYHQSFLPGRSSSPYDVMLDTCGGIFAQLLLLGILRLLARSHAIKPVAV
jgi:VanZ family protein